MIDRETIRELIECAIIFFLSAFIGVGLIIAAWIVAKNLSS